MTLKYLFRPKSTGGQHHGNIHSGGKNGYSPYLYDLPECLSLKDNRSEVEKKFGEFTRVGDGTFTLLSAWSEGVMVTYKNEVI